MKTSGNIRIRPATFGDEGKIARVHIQAWQEAYKGLVPQDYLDNLPSKFEERQKMWTAVLKNPQRWAWVAESDEEILGFVLFGPPRDPNRDGYIELGAIYLLASEKNKGIGFSLLSAGFNRMKDLGYKKAYCWVLENNPTIRFYERSGAAFSGQKKEDEIGGEKLNEVAYQWGSLDIGDYNWSPLSLEEVKRTFASFAQPWLVAGGWAIDLFLRKQTRYHGDIDILIRREDQLRLQEFLAGWDLWAADPPGTLRPWEKGKYFGKGLQDIWGRKTPSDPWQIQIMLFDVQNENWVFKRDESIQLPVAEVTDISEDGIVFLRPEIQLLYKSKSLRAKDHQDFGNAVKSMNTKQKSWLKESLAKVYQGTHPWLERL